MSLMFGLLITLELVISFICDFVGMIVAMLYMVPWAIWTCISEFCKAFYSTFKDCFELAKNKEGDTNE